jgi:hypothetical protein
MKNEICQYTKLYSIVDLPKQHVFDEGVETDVPQQKVSERVD